MNKKFVVAEYFAELVSTVCFTCLEPGFRVGDLTLFEALTGEAFDRRENQDSKKSLKSS